MPLQHHPIHGVAHGLAARRRDIRGSVFRAIDETDSVRIVRSPGIVHANRETEEIPRLSWRMRSVHSDPFQRALVPIPRDGVVGVGDIPIYRRLALDPEER